MSDIDRRQDVQPIVAKMRRERARDWTAVTLALLIAGVAAIFIAGELGYLGTP